MPPPEMKTGEKPLRAPRLFLCRLTPLPPHASGRSEGADAEPDGASEAEGGEGVDALVLPSAAAAAAAAPAPAPAPP